jgi:hypothetical protein
MGHLASIVNQSSGGILNDGVSRSNPDKAYRNSHLRAAAEKLRITQLRDGSFYANARTLVPVAVLGFVWIWVNHYSQAEEFHTLVGRSVTVRHLLLAVGVATLWNLWLSLSLFEHRSIKRDLRDELTRLAMASLVCGALPLTANLAGGTFAKGLYLQEMISAGLLGASYALLGVFLIAAAFSSRLLRPRVALIVGTGKRASLLRQRL